MSCQIGRQTKEKMTKKNKKFIGIIAFCLSVAVVVTMSALRITRANSSERAINTFNGDISSVNINVNGDNSDGASLGGSTSDDWNVGGNLSVTGTISGTGALSSGAITSSGALSVAGASTLTGEVTMKEGVQTITASEATTTVAESGTTFYINLASTTAGSNIVLPAITEGISYRYTMATSSATTTNIVIDSSEGDNIYGSLVVDGTAVPCVAEDQLNFVSTAEVAGDFIELRSDGNRWYVDGVGEASGSITCTDPS